MTDTMLEQLGSAFSQDATTGLFLPTQARKPILPWDDLQALNPPYDLPTIAPSVQPVLAVLSASGSDRARLLTSDDRGRLVANMVTGPVAHVANGVAIGTLTIPVDNSSIFDIGDIVQVWTLDPINKVFTFQESPQIQAIPDVHTIKLNVNGNALNIGDIIKRTPTLALDSTLNTVRVNIPSDIWTEPRAADLFSTQTFTGGVAPSLNLGPSNPSLRFRVNYIKISGRNTTRSDYTGLFTLSDGVTTFWQQYLTIPAIKPPQPDTLVQINVNANTAGLTNTIPAIAGQTVYLWALQYAISAAGAFAGDWEDTAALHLHPDTFQDSGPRYFQFNGFPMAVGVGLNFNTTSPGATFLVGSALFAQRDPTLIATTAEAGFDNISYVSNFGHNMLLASTATVPTGVSIALNMAGSERSD